MGRIIRIRETGTIDGLAGAYAAGDEVSNNTTAGSVTRIEFNLEEIPQGRILGLGWDITPASGNLVNTNLTLEAALFRKPEVPAAVGNDVANPIGAATMALSVARFRPVAGSWQIQTGVVAGTGTSGFAYTVPTYHPGETGTFVEPMRGVYPAWFTFDGVKVGQRRLVVVLRALAAWNNGNVDNTLGLTLDIDVS